MTLGHDINIIIINLTFYLHELKLGEVDNNHSFHNNNNMAMIN